MWVYRVVVKYVGYREGNPNSWSKAKTDAPVSKTLLKTPKKKKDPVIVINS
jgi:hypothetical protein